LFFHFGLSIRRLLKLMLAGLFGPAINCKTFWSARHQLFDC
jgi:hypothetical protein